MAIRFLQQNTKFDSCSQTTIRFFTVKYKILQFYRNSHLVFLQQNTKSVLKRPFVLWLRNTKFLKLFRNFNLLICLSTQFNFHSLFLQEVLMRTHFFTAVFPTINHWFEEAVVGTGNNLSIVFLWIKCNTKFNNASSFVSHCKKAKQDISKSSIFLFLRNETKLIINSYISYFLLANTNWPFGYNFQNSLFRSKKWMAVWVQISKFCVSL